MAYGSFVAEQSEHFVKEGFDITVICPHYKGQKTSNVINGVVVKRFKYFFPVKYQKVAYNAGIPTNLRNSLMARIQLPFFLLSFYLKTLKISKNFSIIYCHWSIPTLIAILLKKCMKESKIIFMNHGAEIFVLGKNKLGERFLSYIISNSDLLISNSSYTYEQTNNIKIHQNHCIISPGVDLKKFKPLNIHNTIRDMYKIPKSHLLLFSLGNFIERKGFEYLIRAINIIVNNNKIDDITLLLGGRGLLMNKYMEMINGYELKNNIILTGYISDSDLLYYYNSCDIFIHPAIRDRNNDTEGLGVVLNEANACGKPIIATRVGGIIDVIQDSINGILVEEKNELELAEAILILRNNPTLMRQIGEKGREIAIKKFSWEENVKKTIELIRNI